MTQHQTPHAPKAPDVNEALQQIQSVKWTELIKKTIELLKKNPVYLVGVAAVPVLVVALLDIFVFPALFTVSIFASGILAGVLLILQLLLAIAAGLISWAAAVHALYQIDQNKVNPNQLISSIQSSLNAFVQLVKDVLIFTKGWIPLSVAIALALLGFGFTLGLPQLTALALVLSPFALIGYLVYLILFFKPLMQSAFAYLNFFYTDKPDAKHSLSHSIETAKGKEFAILGNTILTGLVVQISIGIISSILSAIFAPIGLVPAINAILTAGSTVIMVTFLLVLRDALKK